MVRPDTQYARSGDVHIAYQVMGGGPIDVVFVQGFISNLETQWEDPGLTHLFNRLASFSRLIIFDKRGSGLSDRVTDMPDLETRMDDVRAVLDAVGSRQTVLLGASEGGPMSILFAATYPQRTRALILYGAYAHFHSWVLSPEQVEGFVAGAEAHWGDGSTLKSFCPNLVGNDRFRAWWARFERLGTSPAGAIALARMNSLIDVRALLPAVRVPTLVIHRDRDARVHPAAGRYLVRHIPGARLVEIPGIDHPIWVGDTDRVIDEIEEFLTGVRPAPEANRVLATILCADLADMPPTPAPGWNTYAASASGSRPACCNIAAAKWASARTARPPYSTARSAPCIARSPSARQLWKPTSRCMPASIPARWRSPATRWAAPQSVWLPASPPSPAPVKSSFPPWCATSCPAAACASTRPGGTCRPAKTGRPC